MTRTAQLISLISGALITTISMSQAAPIVINASRNVEIDDKFVGYNFGPQGAYTANGYFFDTFTDDLGLAGDQHPATATQSSEVDPSGTFNAMGHVSVDPATTESYRVRAETTYSIIFNITTPHAFELTVDQNANVIRGHNATTVDLHNSLYTYDFYSLVQNSNSASYSESGILPPGQYSLFANAELSYGNAISTALIGGELTFDFSLVLTEMPVLEPATLGLFGFGLAGLGVAARRQRRT